MQSSKPSVAGKRGQFFPDEEIKSSVGMEIGSQVYFAGLKEAIPLLHMWKSISLSEEKQSAAYYSHLWRCILEETNNTLLMTNLLSSMKVDGCQFHGRVPLAGSHAVPPNKHTIDSLKTNPLKLFIIFFNLLILAQSLHFAFLITSKSWVCIKGNKISIYLLGKKGERERERERERREKRKA